MQPSDQGIETIAPIPLIDSGNIKVPSLKPARFQAASVKTASGETNQSFPAPTKARWDKGWLLMMRAGCLPSFLSKSYDQWSPVDASCRQNACQDLCYERHRHR